MEDAIIEKLEKSIQEETIKVTNKIIESNIILDISAKSRAGAEISDYLEDKFEKNYKKFSNNIIYAEGAPKGATKNPWDLKIKLKLDDHIEEVWVDFKAIKTTGLDSNPDIGTPNKQIKIMQEGFFYILFVYVFYEEHRKGLKFTKINNSYTKGYFLKDISPTFRRNPKNQLQVNVSAEPVKRSREDFIKLLTNKIRESHERQIAISKKSLSEIDKIEDQLLIKNQEIIDNISSK